MSWSDTLSDLLGFYVEPKELGILQVCVRAVIVFLVALVIVRVADKRFLAKMTAFDALLGFVLASALARAINGSAPLIPTLITGFLLVGLQRKSDVPPQGKPGRRCGNRLSKDALPGGDKEPPADRGACEEETSSQGSE